MIEIIVNDQNYYWSITGQKTIILNCDFVGILTLKHQATTREIATAIESYEKGYNFGSKCAYGEIEDEIRSLFETYKEKGWM